MDQPEHGSRVLKGFPYWLPPGTDDDPGRRRYERREELGEGGMGTVFRYRDRWLPRSVAVKSTATSAYARNAELRSRLQREATALARLHHANVAQIHDVLRAPRGDFLVLEFVKGTTLRARLLSGPLPYQDAIAICRQLGLAIEAGECADLVHRDIKPENTMVTPNDEVKLLDFGLARVGVGPTDSTAAWADGTAPGIEGGTARGLMLGTPGYMSPEQYATSEVDHRTDIWAFGCVLYECLAHDMAFTGSTFEERRHAALHEEPDWDLLPEATSSEIREMLRTCLRKDPQKRLSHIAPAVDVLTTAWKVQDPRPHIVPNNLPGALSEYVPRGGEVDVVFHHLCRRRLVTLIGHGGSGKTRLALEVARKRLIGRDTLSPDGVWLVELAALRDPDRVIEHIAATVAGRHDGSGNPAAALVERIGSRRILVLLDNCEHLQEAVRTVTTTLLGRCPELRVLATSRHPINAAEQLFEVEKLPFPPSRPTDDVASYPAVRLFVEAARRVAPAFVLGSEEEPAVAEICRRLEGMPLPIELAAGRVKSIPVALLAERLFEALDPRHVLDSSIAWSVDLLEPDERRLLGRLAAFRGGWRLEDAEHVCGNDHGRLGRETVLHLLTQLHDKSLVMPATDRSRSELLEIVRLFAARVLLRGAKGVRARRRHRDHFLALAERAYREFYGPEQVAWLDRLAADHDNLRAALSNAAGDPGGAEDEARLATALHPFWRERGHLAEARSALEHAIRRREDEHDVLHVRTLNAAGTIAASQQDDRALQRFFGHAMEIARNVADRELRNRLCAGMLTNWGLGNQECGDLAESRQRHEASLALYRELDDRSGVAWVKLHLALVAKLEGRLGEAKQLLREVLVVVEENGDTERIGSVLSGLGEIAVHEGAPDEAIELLQGGLRHKRLLRNPVEIASSAIWIGIVCTRRGDHVVAARLFGAAEDLLASSGVRMSKSDRVDYEPAATRARSALGDRRFERARSTGAAMTYERAVREALEVPARRPCASS